MPKQLGVAIESQYKPSFNSLKIINSYRRSNKISLNQIYFIQKKSKISIVKIQVFPRLLRVRGVTSSRC